MPQVRDRDLLLELLDTAINKCYANDYCLIDRSMERASVARIFLYMSELIHNDLSFEVFREYDLDCEYNKNGEQVKWTPRCPKGTFPDIILHKRNDNEENLLVVEFKSARGKFRYYNHTTRTTSNKRTSESDTEVDFVKLEDFTNPTVYDYFLGVFVRLGKENAEHKYFQAGHQLSTVRN